MVRRRPGDAKPPDYAAEVSPPHVSLREHLLALLAEMDLRYQQRYDAQIKALDAALLAAEKAVQTALTASEKAVIKAEGAAEKRFDAVNEFRKAYQDLIGMMMPRTEAEQRLTNMAEQIAELKVGAADRLGGTRGVGALVGYMVAVGTVVAVVVAVISLVTR